MTGSPIDARTALAWGLVTEVCPLDKLPSVGGELAGAVAKNAPVAVQIAKQMLDGDCAPLESIAGSLSAYTNDGQEGVNSFLERREPKYKGD